MNDERLRQVETLYRAVLESGPDRRSDLLAQADPRVRREVESLLEQRSGTELLNDPRKAVPLSHSDATRPAPGLQLGPYRIGTELGKGGMGQVFRAHDTRLGRDVAIKFCTEGLSERFHREARAIAALNHPHICTLHDVGRDYLVMELVEGQTLARRVGRGAIPVVDAIGIARQIATALEAAHDKGIVHRDLKPGNVMLKPDGTAKVLDFGLAKTVPPQTCGDSTLTIDQTQPGAILGTAGYMAPEQVRGEEIDKRADIWAFGVVLYEMLTGTQPFERKTPPDTLTAVLTETPDWQRVPGLLQRLVRRCLEKNPTRRLRDIGDARIELEELTLTADIDPRVTAPADQGNRSRRTLWLVLVLTLAGIALCAVIAALLLRDRRTPSSAPVTRTTILLPPNQIMNDAVARGSGPTRHQLAVSPDGQFVVYVASTGGRSQLFIRGLAEFDAKPLPHTEGANFPTFSPDGRWIAFFANYRLQKVSISGGAPITVCDVPIIGRGASWGPADTIVFSAGEPHGLWRVSASGGTPEQITKAAGTSANWHSWPHILPDGKSVVFTIGGWGPGGLALLSLDTREWKPLLKTQAKQPRYLPTGHLVYAVEGALRAVPFDLATLRITGSPVPVLDPVFDESGAGGTEFAISASGTLVFLPGGVNYLIVWVDRSGRVTPLTREAQGYRFPDLSPDDTHVTVTVDPPDQGDSHIWIYDVSSGTGRRLTHEGHNLYSAWTGDGSRIAWGSHSLWWQAADGAGKPELLSRDVAGSPNAFSPDGRWLLFHFRNTSTDFDLAVLPLAGDQTPISIAAGPGREIDGAISRNGRWVAFSSDESGSSEIYVQPFPGAGRKIRVSTDGGNWPVWTENELFYVNGPQMIAVRVQTGNNFQFGKPEVLFEDGSLIGSGGNQRFDATRNGQKFLMVRNADRIQGTQLRVVLNWFEELKAKIPTQ